MRTAVFAIAPLLVLMLTGCPAPQPETPRSKGGPRTWPVTDSMREACPGWSDQSVILLIETYDAARTLAGWEKQDALDDLAESCEDDTRTDCEQCRAAVIDWVWPTD